MPYGEKFPHLKLILRGRLRADFGRRNIPVPEEVQANRANRTAHTAKLRTSIERVRQHAESEAQRRQREGLPSIPAGAGFVMRVPDRTDPESLAHALGVELVAEADGGFLLVATEDITLQKLQEVLAKFDSEDYGGGAAATLLEVFESPDHPHRLERLLVPEILAMWPFTDGQEYIFDISIQTAEGTRSFSLPAIHKRKEETEEIFEERKKAARTEAIANADCQWIAQAEKRFAQMEKLMRFYGGNLLTGLAADQPVECDAAIRFPDSIQIRARVNGRGWRDIIQNLPNLFEVSLPDDVEQPFPPSGLGDEVPPPAVSAPDANAPAVCVIDSGIQEGHIWLEPAIDTAVSRCFLPDRDRTDVYDEVTSGGHGTRVAGAVLYPREVPRSGRVEPVAFLQNARVLNADNKLPVDLPPAKYIEEVVAHFHASAKRTRLFNHSVAGNTVCALRRMSTWATKIDELSNKYDVLFIQASGNIDGSNTRPNNPGVFENLQAGRQYPDYLEEPASRIANPAQSLQALTVGSVSAEAWTGGNKRSFAAFTNAPSAFSRSGLGMWGSIKPEVVEIGGDFAATIGEGSPPTIERETAIELLRAAGDGGPAFAKDAVGTSYAAPKVSHLAARLQRLFPECHTLLYRGLIVHSARWPDWFNGSGWTVDRALQLMGFGLPSVERATENAEHRVTLITPNAVVIRNQELHLYRVIIPDELRNRVDDVMLRIDVTLSYSAEPRRTRSSRRGYLETWLDWRSSGIGEPLEVFQKRVGSDEDQPARDYRQLDWCLHYYSHYGDASETHRGNGTIQKDWSRVLAHDLAEDFAIAVRAHKGWNHREGSGGAKYCLIVSIEAEDIAVPVYTAVSSVNLEIEAAVEERAQLRLG